VGSPWGQAGFSTGTRVQVPIWDKSPIFPLGPAGRRAFAERAGSNSHRSSVESCGEVSYKPPIQHCRHVLLPSAHRRS
jgi:hypothetical protein